MHVLCNQRDKKGGIDSSESQFLVYVYKLLAALGQSPSLPPLSIALDLPCFLRTVMTS